MNFKDIFGNCQCVALNEEKLRHLQEILQNSGIKVGEKNLLTDEKFIDDVRHCDELLQTIFSPSTAPLLNSTFCFDCNNHVPTKYHSESLDTHLLAVSFLAKTFAKYFFAQFSTTFQEQTNLNENEFESLCKVAGLFHDIGKPFVRNSISKKAEKHPIYTGHAQIGSRLINQVNFLSHGASLEEVALIEKYKVCLEWAVNHHMCSCTHMHDIAPHFSEMGLHLVMDLGSSDGEDNDLPAVKELRIISFAILSVLSFADHLGRLSIDLIELRQTIDQELEISDQESSDDSFLNPANRQVMSHSYSLFQELLLFDPNDDSSPLYQSLPEFNGKLIVITFGFSGSGKSYTVQRLKEKFGSDYEVIHVERDQSLYKVHEKLYGPTAGKTYAEVYGTVYSNNNNNSEESEPPLPPEHSPHHLQHHQRLHQSHYHQDQRSVHHHQAASHASLHLSSSVKPGKSFVQEQWVQDIADGLETPQQKAGQIIILDSVQPLFPSQWQTTLRSLKSLSEEAFTAFLNAPKIGYYSIPIHMFGQHIPHASSIVSKTGKYFLMPPPEEEQIRGLFYPGIYTEKEIRSREGSGSTKSSSSASEQESGGIVSAAVDPFLMDEQTILYSTGSFTLLSNYLQQYFSLQQMALSRQIAFIQGNSINDSTDPSSTRFKRPSVLPQQTVVPLFNRIQQQYHFQTFADIFDTFLREFLAVSKGHLSFIHYKIELENATIQLISLIYEDGLQSFTGTTRDYRGEGLLFHKQSHHCLSIRPSLPVFPEMASIQKDPKTFPYLFPIWKEIDSLQNPLYQQIKRAIVPKEDYHLYLVPKYDGSLFNCTFIHRSNHLLYEMISQLLQEKESVLAESVTAPAHASYYFYREGLFLMGSKGTILSKNPVNDRIHRAIEGSYESLDRFLQLAYDYLTSSSSSSSLFPLAHSVITLHYEAIDAVPSPELTVFYDRAWCPYFGCTVYHQLTNHKTFHLPIEDYCPASFPSLATIYDCGSDWRRVHQIYEENYERLLAGELEVEPEGYVVHIFGKQTSSPQTALVGSAEVEWLPIKYKYKLYYTAHKPSSKHHLEMAMELTSNPKYQLICQRLAKFRHRPSLSQLLAEQEVLFQQMLSTIQHATVQIAKIASVTSILDLSPEEVHSIVITKKDWALFWKERTVFLDSLVQQLELLQGVLVVHYEQFKDLIVSKMAFNFLMRLYDQVQLNHSLEGLQRYDAITLMKYLEEFLLR